MQCPEDLASAQRVELIPAKRFQPAAIQYLERHDIEALLASRSNCDEIAIAGD